MGYGKKVEDKKTPSVGVIEDVKIDGNTLFTIEEKDGKTTASITFIQPDGAGVTTRLWDNSDEDSIEQTNAWVHHVCTKIVSKEEYETAVASAESFVDFFNRVNRVIGQQFVNNTYRMLFHYNKKNFVTTPRYAPFIESMDISKEASAINKMLAGNTKSAQYIKKFLVLQEVNEPDAEESVSEVSGEKSPF